jgi:hypothetical protein
MLGLFERFWGWGPPPASSQASSGGRRKEGLTAEAQRTLRRSAEKRIRTERRDRGAADSKLR